MSLTKMTKLNKIDENYNQIEPKKIWLNWINSTKIWTKSLFKPKINKWNNN